MQWKKVCATAFSIVILSGCSAAQQGNADAPPGQGGQHSMFLSYRLPERQLQAEITYQLRKCRYNSDGDLEFEVKIGASVTPSIVPSAQSFTFDPTSLPDARVAQNVSVSLYPNATIKSLNATSEDKTGSIITGVFKFVGGLVKSFAGLGFDAQKVKSQPLCVDKVQKSLEAVDRLKKCLGQRKKELADKLRAAPNDTNAKIVTAYQKVVEGIKSEIAEIRTGNLTIVKKFSVGPKGLSSHHFLELTEDELRTWLTEQGYKHVRAAELKRWIDNNWGTIPTHPILLLDLHLKDAVAEAPISAELAAARDRLIVRRPKQTSFEVCMWTCVDANKGPAMTKRFAAGATTVPQWSQAQTIPFDVAVFQKRVLRMSFADDGQVTELTWDAPARADALATALSGISEGAATLIDTIQYARINAEIKELETETKLYKARVAHKEAREEFLEAFSTDEDGSATDASAP